MQPVIAQQDTTKSRFPVQKTTVETVEDLTRKLPADLQTPSNIKTEVFYDYKVNRYVFQNKIGDKVIGIPFTMTPEEYMDYTLRELNNRYFKDRNAVRKEEKPAGKEPLPLFNLRQGKTLLEDIFGPGGIQVVTRGSIELSSGLKRNVIDNPTLPERSRKRTRFDLDPQIQLDVNAKVGNKINFGLSYDTDAAFNFDARRVKLA
ncbi:MAG TPA: hypothetical protein DEP71_09155, partial [Porphyromonadaceae bacterium]|nr:hypothetical protein [Porphyromonadaceae bacterium]